MKPRNDEPINFDVGFTDLSDAKSKPRSSGVKQIRSNIPLVNCLLVGASGSGKSTFLKVLADSSYSVSEADISSVTKEASEHKFLIESEFGKFSFVRFIDTPGFGDTGVIDDVALQRMIADFVKRGFRSVHQVLVTIPYNRRIDSTQAIQLMNVLQFLGKTLKPVSRILYTHSEGATNEQVEVFNTAMSKSRHTRRIHGFCGGKFHSTGMSQLSGATDVSKFRVLLGERISSIVSDAINSKPVELMGNNYNEAASRFIIFEGAGKSALTLRETLPKMSSASREVLELRSQVEHLVISSPGEFEEHKSEIDGCLKVTEDLTLAKMDLKTDDWTKSLHELDQYVARGGNLEQSATEVSSLYRDLTEIKTRLRELLFDMEC